MTIEATVIADSVNAQGRRLTTFQLRYPRFIHAEFMTHRHFSRNASSSRAIPVEKQIAMLIEDTAMPVHWGKNQSGMQADGEHDAPVIFGDGSDNSCQSQSTIQGAWEIARDNAVEVAQAMLNAGYHKQVVNRILEPFSHITVVCTSSQYENFFALRRHPDAQPEIKVLADAMFEAMEASSPAQLSVGEWHLPYVTQAERGYVTSVENTQHAPVPTTLDDLIKASVARCARVSYLTHDGQSPSLEKDMALYTRLVGSVPLHASPAEHQATPDSVIWDAAELKSWENHHLHGNFSGGWCQYRKMLPNECYDTWEGLNDFG